MTHTTVGTSLPAMEAAKELGALPSDSALVPVEDWKDPAVIQALHSGEVDVAVIWDESDIRPVSMQTVLSEIEEAGLRICGSFKLPRKEELPEGNGTVDWYETWLVCDKGSTEPSKIGCLSGCEEEVSEWIAECKITGRVIETFSSVADLIADLQDTGGVEAAVLCWSTSLSGINTDAAVSIQGSRVKIVNSFKTSYVDRAEDDSDIEWDAYWMVFEPLA